MSRILFPLLTALAIAGLGCSSEDSKVAGTGGHRGTGGRVGTGGASAGTGGAAAATGGSPAGTGGITVGTGGASAGTGGAVAATGGSPAGTGGSPTGTGGAVGGTAGAVGAAGATGTGGISGSTGGAPASSEIVGWATMPGHGVQKTTGGGDVTPIVVTTMADLNKHAAGTDPRVIHVSGKLTGRLSVGSNKTIIGLSGAAIQYTGGSCAIHNGGEVGGHGAVGVCTLSVFNSQNVIIKNIKFVAKPSGGGDSAVIENSHHVWIDHCEFLDAQAGLLDILGSSDFVTVSWSKFSYTAKGPEHLAMIMALNNVPVGGPGRYNITLHHNWWGENINERMPRARFGKVHVFNSLMAPQPNHAYYAIRPGAFSNVRSENNIYRNFQGKPYSAAPASFAFSYHDASDSILESIGDLFIDCTAKGADQEGAMGGTMSRGTAFVPPYPYTAEPTATLEAAIKAGAGPH